MQLRPEQLGTHLKQGLAPVYLLYGEETLVAQEAADAIRGSAREQGYVDREVFHVETGFDWGQLTEAASALSLFADRRILELRIPSGKPGDAGSRALTAYTESPAPDTLLLIICGKLEAAQRRAKWFKALDSAGVSLAAWPIDARQLPRWIGQRLQRAGLSAEPEAVQMLAERVEGNLLAAAQEVDKLALLYPGEKLDAARVAEAVSDSARFDVFGLVDVVLTGQAGRAVRMLAGLRQEGVEPVLVNWALNRELRSLEAMAWALAHGESLAAVQGRFRVWKNRQPVVAQALQRHRLPAWYGFLRRSARIDRIIKGQAAGNPWDELVQLSLDLAGRPLGLTA
ncbi:DNA polymerase III subunit delta [Thiohalobacter thiocyanaticus]|uniref:DNA polymerase III subunit delta n=1 Tax=Thiohalobacter thiocyanaticus TaxID=585455 RepID=A0A426QHM5_9GAMM|nr:DNA polymerase III subunit delta [Thiohalobacter thiocyanaticus]RRQ21259.1 DNA polymerase III subunit delta [Thiohalobacter thiocyanaticus]